MVRPQDGGLTDAHLLERYVRDGDEAAFEVLAWRHGPMVLSVCRRVLRHEQDAAEKKAGDRDGLRDGESQSLSHVEQ